jgi:hypothetical protein
MYKRIYRNEKYRLRNDGETSNDGDASTIVIEPLSNSYSKILMQNASNIFALNFLRKGFKIAKH